jgi:hypothetical protein
MVHVTAVPYRPGFVGLAVLSGMVPGVWRHLGHHGAALGGIRVGRVLRGRRGLRLLAGRVGVRSRPVSGVVRAMLHRPRLIVAAFRSLFGLS